MLQHVSVQQSPRILIVEDEFLVALQIEHILSDEGYRVVGTVSDRAALDAIEDCPDVALVDLNLRDGLTGPDIARELANRYGAKVVYITANPAQIGDPAATAVGVVEKPFSRDVIIGAICFALNGADESARPAELRCVPTQH